jgi:hypothetical protein
MEKGSRVGLLQFSCLEDSCLGGGLGSRLSVAILPLIVLNWLRRQRESWEMDSFSGTFFLFTLYCSTSLHSTKCLDDAKTTTRMGTDRGEITEMATTMPPIPTRRTTTTIFRQQSTQRQLHRSYSVFMKNPFHYSDPSENHNLYDK